MKRRDLNFFLIGIILTLLIFGFITPTLPKFQIIYSIPTSWPDFLTAIGTVGATVAAVFFGLGGKEKFLPPDMNIIDNYENKQSNGSIVQGHTRLKLINNGSSKAKNVNVYVEQIKDNGILRGDFLPVPLRWTHNGNWFRDFPSQETWFLDLCRKDDITNNQFPKLVLGPGEGVENYQNLYEGKTTLRLKVSDESGKMRRYNVILEWKIGEPYVRVKSFDEV